MSRSRVLIAAGLAAVAVVAVLLATGALSGSGKGGSAQASSPICLPSTLNHDARLAGTSIDVSPAPETGTANPHTQISFLGVPATQIHVVSVTAAHSGPHPGRLQAYSQGDGASFLPNAAFEPGEHVSVRATILATETSTGTRRGRTIAFGFRVDTPYSTTSIPPFPTLRPRPRTMRASTLCRAPRPRFSASRPPIATPGPATSSRPTDRARDNTGR